MRDRREGALDTGEPMVGIETVLDGRGTETVGPEPPGGSVSLGAGIGRDVELQPGLAKISISANTRPGAGWVVKNAMSTPAMRNALNAL